MIVAFVAIGIASAVMLISAGLVVGFLIGRRTSWTTPALDAVAKVVIPREPKPPQVEKMEPPVEFRTEWVA